MSWLTNLLGIKQSQTRPLIAYMGQSKPESKIRNESDYAKEGFNKNTFVFRCIELVAGSASEVPLLLFKKGKGQELDTEIPNHEVLDLLSRPNSMQGDTAFIKMVLGYYLISGNTYVEAVGPEKDPRSMPKKVKELWPVRPDYTTIISGSMGVPTGYKVDAGKGKSKVFPVDIMGRSQIMHMKTFNPTNDWYGLSPIQVGSLSVDQQNELNTWNLGLLQNSARPSGALIFNAKDGEEQRLSEEQLADLRKQITETYTGARNSGKPMLLEGGMDWKEMGLSPKDMEWISSKNTTARDIANVFGVPPQLLNIPGDSTFNNYKEARLAFYQDTVLPTLNVLIGHLNTWLMPVFGDDLYLTCDKDSLDALAPLREKRWEQVQNSTWLTTNEKREMTGFGKYDQASEDAADKILVNAGMIPLDQAAESFDFNDPSDPKPPTDDEDFREDEDEDEDLEKQAQISYVQGKSFNLSNNNQKRRFWALQIRRRKKFERTFQKQMVSAFKKEAELMSKSLDGVSEDLVEVIIQDVFDQTRESFEKIYSANLRSVMTAFGQDVLSLGKSSRVNIETKDAQSRFDFFLQTFIENEVGKKITNIQRTTRKRVIKNVRDELSSAVLDEGEGIPQIAKRVQSTYRGFTVARATTIARTEVHNASNVASRSAAKSLDLPNMQKEWISSLDDRTRRFEDGAEADHTVMNGVKVDMHMKFDVPSVYGTDQMDGPGDPNAPARQIINCFLPENKVEGNIVAGSRAFYSGNVLEVFTKSGARISVTPNHPVLTDKGFVPAKSLVVGQNLFRDRLKVHGSTKPHDKNNEPALIKDIFQSLSVISDSKGCELTAQDFHGDALSMIGKVDIIVPDRKLLDKVHSFMSEDRGKLVLKKESMSVASLSGDGPGSLSNQIIPSPSSCRPGGFTLSLDGSSVELQSLPLQKFSFGLTSHLDAMFYKVSVKRNSNDSGFFADLVQRFSGQIFNDEIVDIRNFNYSGHVYDLQSDTGNLLADGILTSNCRCTLAYSAPLE